MSNQCNRSARSNATGWTSNVFTFPEGVRVTHIGGEEAPRSPGGTLIGPWREASRDPNANASTISRAQQQAQRLIENQVRKYKSRSPERNYERTYDLDDSFTNPSSPVSYVPYYAPPARRNETYEEMIARRLREVGETKPCEEESVEDELARHAELAAEAARKAQIHSQKTNENTELAICHATQAAEMFEEIQRQREQEQATEQVCPEPIPEEPCEQLQGRFTIPSPCPEAPPVVITTPPCPCPQDAPVTITAPPCPSRPKVCKVDSPGTAHRKKYAQRIKEFKLKQAKTTTESKLLRPSRQPSTVRSTSKQNLSRAVSSRAVKAKPPPCAPVPEIPQDDCAIPEVPDSPTTAKTKKLLQSMADFDRRFQKMGDLIPRPNRPPSTFTCEPQPPTCPSTTSTYKSKALNVGSRKPLNVPSTRTERPLRAATGVPSYMQSTKAAANRAASITRQSTVSRASRIPVQGEGASRTSTVSKINTTASRLNTASSRFMTPVVNRAATCKPNPPVTASRIMTQRRVANFAAPTESTVRRATSKKTTTCKR